MPAYNEKEYMQLKRIKIRWGFYHDMAEQGSKKALAYYTKKKDSFIRAAQAIDMEMQQDFAASLTNLVNQKIEKEANKNDVARKKALIPGQSKTLEELFVDDLQTLGERMALDAIKNQKLGQNDTKAYTNSLLSKYAGLKTELLDQIRAISKNQRDRLNKNIDMRMKQTGWWKGYFQNTSLSNNQALIDQMRSYVRRYYILLLNEYEKNTDIHLDKYITTSAGYLREEGLADAIMQILQKLNGQLSSSHGKVIGTTLNAMGQMDKGDVGIGLPGTFSISATGQAKYDFTISSKSWKSPWAKFKEGTKANRNNLSEFPLANVSRFYPKDEEEQYWWHAGVGILMSHLIEVIGPTNILFSTRDKVYWTNDFINTMLKNNYVVAYYKYKTSINASKAKDQGRGTTDAHAKDQLSPQAYIMYHDDNA